MCAKPPIPKILLAVWHTANKGKTETLREFAKLLLRTYPRCRAISPNPAMVPASGDFRLVMRLNNKIMAVDSKGDPHTGLADRLYDLADNFQADVIICSTRTKGETVAAVEDLRVKRNYDLIWTSTYQTDFQHGYVNRIKARHIMELLRGLSII